MTTTQMFKPTAAAAKPASLKSLNYLAALQHIDADNMAEWKLAWEEADQPTVSAAIKKALANKAPAAPKWSLEKGQWHLLNGNFYRVAVSQSTGKFYAKVRVPGSGFEFASGVAFKLTEATLVNARHTPQISAYGHTYHRCVFCNLPLDLPESITAGYGETCAANHGLPWG